MVIRLIASRRRLQGLKSMITSYNCIILDALRRVVDFFTPMTGRWM
jgi:hypothetical protein